MRLRTSMRGGKIEWKTCSYLGRKVVLRRWILVGVSDERVGYNSIKCMNRQRWVHRRCTDVPR